MKKLVALCTVIVVVILLTVTACQTGGGQNHTPIPARDLLPAAGEEVPDDIVPTPGGMAYRANVHHYGEENPWPPIESSEVALGSGSKAVYIRYRDYIETKGGEARNNIFNARRESGFDEGSLNLYATSIPLGVKLAQSVSGGIPGTLATVLVIEISPGVAPGQYNFEVGLEINGKDYGTIPCTIKVLE